jgi:hypothetical protein
MDRLRLRNVPVHTSVWRLQRPREGLEGPALDPPINKVTIAPAFVEELFFTVKFYKGMLQM